jgi:hypothetical protein
MRSFPSNLSGQRTFLYLAGLFPKISKPFTAILAPFAMETGFAPAFVTAG